MNIISKNEPCQKIESGDMVLVRSCSEIGLVGKHAGDNIKFKNFPYPIINLSNGGVIDWYDSIESMSRDCDLLAKNKDITLTY